MQVFIVKQLHCPKKRIPDFHAGVVGKKFGCTLMSVFLGFSLEVLKTSGGLGLFRHGGFYWSNYKIEDAGQNFTIF